MENLSDFFKAYYHKRAIDGEDPSDNEDSMIFEETNKQFSDALKMYKELEKKRQPQRSLYYLPYDRNLFDYYEHGTQNMHETVVRRSMRGIKKMDTLSPPLAKFGLSNKVTKPFRKRNKTTSYNKSEADGDGSLKTSKIETSCSSSLGNKNNLSYNSNTSIKLGCESLEKSNLTLRNSESTINEKNKQEIAKINFENSSHSRSISRTITVSNNATVVFDSYGDETINQYRVNKSLGKGGYGEVFLVENIETNEFFVESYLYIVGYEGTG